MEECLPVECRWILLISQCEPRELAVSLCLALALHYGKLAEIRLLLPSLIFMQAERDGTYALQKMITLLESRIQKLPMDSEAIPLDLTSLRYQYPQLRDYQIRFYLEHSVKGYFYTLEQFVAFSGVCYETARCAMEQLVSLHFYDKLKQGRKFVYTRP